MEYKLLIGKIIKYMRINNNLTQEELSKKLNIGRTTLSDYEREKTDINFDIINNICQVCDYDVVFVNKKTNEIITTQNIDRKI